MSRIARLGRNRRGFTLIELLIVIVIIAVLMAIVVAVGAKVVGSGKEKMTIGAIKILEESLTEVISQNSGVLPEPYVQDPRAENDGTYVQPIADARNFTKGRNRQVVINSVGLFMFQAGEFEGVKEIFSGLDSKMVNLYNPDRLRRMQVLTLLEHWDLPTVMDGWGRPMRYVHPAFDGLIFGADWNDPQIGEEATPVEAVDVYPLPLRPTIKRYAFDKFRRNNMPTVNDIGAPVDPDADGGICRGNHPYFYSAGPDGNPATIEDNVYSVQPQIQTLD